VTANQGDLGTGDPLQPAVQGGGTDRSQAGFQSVTLPEITTEAAEYREGTFTWTRKFQGPPTVSDVSLMRGVAKYDTTFHDWIMAGINGEEYRADITIYHYQRSNMAPAAGVPGGEAIDDAFRRIECKECMCTRAKPGGDFDSTSGEISLMECDFALESFEIVNPTE
jgi:phage tail-like protein